MDQYPNQISAMADEFCRILEKRSSIGAALELAGLGTLAAPHIFRAGKLGKYLQTEKGLRVAELAGLGMLATPSMADIIRPHLPRRFRPKKLRA